MIIGIGSDLADIRRIAGTLERFGERFRNRTFTEVEQALAERRADPSGAYAKRWAAKEACAKALGCGIGPDCAFLDMGVVSDERGKPSLVITGGARERLLALTPDGFEPHVHLTMTDEHPYAQAFVVIEAVRSV